MNVVLRLGLRKKENWNKLKLNGGNQKPGGHHGFDRRIHHIFHLLIYHKM